MNLYKNLQSIIFIYFTLLFYFIFTILFYFYTLLFFLLNVIRLRNRDQLNTIFILAALSKQNSRCRGLNLSHFPGRSFLVQRFDVNSWKITVSSSFFSIFASNGAS